MTCSDTFSSPYTFNPDWQAEAEAEKAEGAEAGASSFASPDLADVGQNECSMVCPPLSQRPPPQVQGSGVEGVGSEGLAPYPGKVIPYPEKVTPHPKKVTPYPEMVTPYPEKVTPYPGKVTPYPKKVSPYPTKVVPKQGAASVCKSQTINPKP